MNYSCLEFIETRNMNTYYIGLIINSVTAGVGYLQDL